MPRKPPTSIQKAEVQNNIATVNIIRQSVKAAFEQLADLLSQELSPAHYAAAYRFVNDEITKPVKEIREMARDALLNFVEEHGEKIPNTPNRKFFAGPFTMTRRVSLSKLPDTNALLEYLKAKKIDRSLLFDQVVTYELNPHKLEAAIRDGLLDKQTVEQMKKVTQTALIVEEE